VNGCQGIIHKNEIWKYLNLNSTAPSLRGLVKLHKENTPIRLLVNWKNAPGYKLTKTLAGTLTSYIPLPYIHNVKNTV
jgi:hypothetical protein